MCRRRKWLPPPLRKLSQGKVDKVVSTSSSAASTAAAATVNSGIPLASTSLTTVTTATTTTTTTTAISSITATTTGTTTTTTPTTTALVKNTTTVGTVTPSGKNIGSLKKSTSDKRFKLPSGGAVEQKRAVTVSAGSSRIVSEFEPFTGAEEVEREEEAEEEEEEEHVENSETISATYDDGEGNVFHEQNGTEDGEDDLELPPPMKPITEPILVASGNGPPGSTIPDELPGKRVSTVSSNIISILRILIFLILLDIRVFQ